MRFLLRTTGEVLITVGLIVLGFMAYMYWGTALREGNAQRTFIAELSRQWSADNTGLAVLTNPNQMPAGQPFALMTIPRFGPHWKFAVVQGIGLPQLAVGPGHVPGTALPGQIGNFAVAAHRVTAGNPFWSLPSLRPGDLVYIETITATFEYQVIGKPDLVSANDVDMLSPVPGHPGEIPRRRLIMLITCDPPWTGTNRVIVTGVLIATLPRGQGAAG